MKYFLLLIALTPTACQPAFADNGVITNYLRLAPTTLPALCHAGDIRFDTSSLSLQYCNTSNTWTAFTAGLGTTNVANGGTGRTTFTAHSLLIGEGTSALNNTGAGVVGSILAGMGSSADPAFTSTPVLGINATTAGTLGLANGGVTGATVTLANPSSTSPWNFNLPIGAGTTGQCLISQGGGSAAMIWGACGSGSGTVTSVGLSVPSFLSVTGSPVTTSGTLAVTLSGTALPAANGGTGQTTLASAFTSLYETVATTGGDIIYAGSGGAPTRLANGSSGQYLMSNGTTLAPTWNTVSGAGTVTSVAATVPAFLSVSGSPITGAGTLAFTLSGTALPVLNGGTGVTSSTGTGSVVLSTSPTLVTPALGTPASGVATNITGLPLTTGVTGVLPIANGGTGNTSYTSASVPYYNGTILTDDNANFNYDGTNHRLNLGGTSGGIGFLNINTSSSASYGLEIQDTGGSPFVLMSQGAAINQTTYQSANSATNPNQINLNFSRGTIAARAAVNSGDLMSRIQTSGYYTGLGVSTTGSTAVDSYATQAGTTSTSQGGKLSFKTTPNNSTTLTEALRLDQDQTATFATTTTAPIFSGGLNNTWTTGQVYVAGQQVSYANETLVCVTGHTASAAIETDIGTGKWAVMSNSNHPQPNLMLAGNNFENNGVGGWTGTGIASLTNGLPTSVGSGGTAFGTGNGGRALGANTTAPAVTASSPINGLYSLNFATSGAGTVGDGYISQIIPISSAYQAKVLTLKFNYKSASGAPALPGTSSNTYAAAVYDVTNNAWLGMAGNFNIVQSAGVGQFVGTVQTASNTANLQIFVYSPVAPVGASSFLLDDFYLGAQVAALGPAMSDLVSYTPTLVGFGTPTGVNFKSRRVGDSLEVWGTFTTGTSTAVTGTVSIGYNGSNANVTVDTNKISSGTYLVGHANINASSTTYFATDVLVSTGASVLEFGNQSSTTSSTVATNATNIGTGVLVTMFASVPIVGWSSNAVQSSDTLQQIVSMAATHASASVTGASTVTGWTTVKDSTGSFAASTGVYTVPVAGDYQVNFTNILPGSGSTLPSIMKNGSSVSDGTIGTAGSTDGIATTLIPNCVPGDLITVQIGSTATIAPKLQIFRLSGPAVVQATESVQFRATNTAGTSVTTSLTQMPFAVTTYDSHSAFSGSNTYTCPVSGKFSVTANLATAAVTLTTAQRAYMQLYKNGSAYSTLAQVAGTGGSINLNMSGSDDVSCLAGDTLAIYAISAVATTLDATAGFNHLSIKRTGN